MRSTACFLLFFQAALSDMLVGVGCLFDLCLRWFNSLTQAFEQKELELLL